MNTLNYTEARNSLASLMEAANSDREPITITRNGRASVVLMDADEYASIMETFHLLSSPANAERLRRSLADSRSGKTVKGELADVDD